MKDACKQKRNYSLILDDRILCHTYVTVSRWGSCMGVFADGEPARGGRYKIGKNPRLVLPQKICKWEAFIAGLKADLQEQCSIGGGG